MKPFSAIKVMRKRRRSQEEILDASSGCPEHGLLVTGTARLNMELCPYHELGCLWARSAAKNSHLIPGGVYVILWVPSSEDLRDCGQICFSQETRIEEKNPKPKTKTLAVLLWGWEIRFEHIQEYNFVKYWKETSKWNSRMERLNKKKKMLN